MLGEHEKMIREKFCYKILKSDRKLEKGYSQVLVKQTIATLPAPKI